ncbi:bifunctional phosphoribosylaminoimidazolecarboxamide formyltransferase/IMP cyclohydrolase [Myxococcota bacterium]|nr:bifunctional phosphoribosylaminoimidazolecarboxamide formyltransferase/IMP cyclohydrolase [Myxococcota bacterium]
MKRAVISVSDKTGVEEFARGLVDLGFQIISTGGTAKSLREAGLQVTDVSEVTGFPECLEGRVKTLHPNVMAGILARNTPEHVKTISELGIDMIDLVAVNLYPFQQTIARAGVTEAEAIEKIDIGGPSMIRAAAKNSDRVTVLVDPADYGPVLEELRATGATSDATRRRLMVKVFAMTAAYDMAVASHFGAVEGALPDVAFAGGVKYAQLRYGENGHQRAAVYVPAGTVPKGMIGARQLQGKELSYNNYVDMEAAWALVREFDDRPAVSIIKHTNPAGFAWDPDHLRDAYEKALATDPVSAFGGIVALNREVDEALAERLNEHFYEVIICPTLTEGARQFFAKKKNLRVMEMGDDFFQPMPTLVFKQVSGGMLVQDNDPPADEVKGARVVTKRAPTKEEWDALECAWKVAKHVKSNAIVFCFNDRTGAVGAGQMSRVDSARLAVMKAVDRKIDIRGTVVGSDAFFPFADGVEEIAAAGATAIAQPGGSIRDQEVIDAADRLGLAMVFTGTRHFRH